MSKKISKKKQTKKDVSKKIERLRTSCLMSIAYSEGIKDVTDKILKEVHDVLVMQKAITELKNPYSYLDTGYIKNVSFDKLLEVIEGIKKSSDEKEGLRGNVAYCSLYLFNKAEIDLDEKTLNLLSKFDKMGEEFDEIKDTIAQAMYDTDKEGLFCDEQRKIKTEIPSLDEEYY